MEPHLDQPIKLKGLQYHFATSGVYVIYCSETDTYYVGQAQVVLRRLVDHFSQLEANKHHNELLQKEFSRFGPDAFVCDLINEMPGATPHQLMQQETKEIQRYKLYHKQLYNSTISSTIKISSPSNFPFMPTTKNKQVSKPVRRTLSENKPYTEKLIDEGNRVQVTCFDCGTTGILTDAIFNCDDDIRRCVGCIEKYLDSWLIEYEPNQYTKKRKATDQYRRWQIAKTHAIGEQLTLAIKNFIAVYKQYPLHLFVNNEYPGPATHRGYMIQKRGLTPFGYIDIQIRQ